jgi:hypothetical protein
MPPFARDWPFDLDAAQTALRQNVLDHAHEARGQDNGARFLGT